MSNNTPITSRVDQAATAMGITPDKVWELLGKLGIDKGSPDAEALLDADTTQEGDARTVFVENGGPVKVVRFKLGWAILKGKKSASTVSGEMAIGAGGTLGNLIEMLRPVGKMSNEELLAKYGQSCPADVLDELTRRSKGRSVIVFEGEAVLVPPTLTLLSMAQTRETPATFKVGEKIYRTYRVGDFAQSFVEECPIHGEVILAGGYCEKCMQDWAGVDNETRVAVRVAVDMGAIGTNTLNEVNWLFGQLKTKGKTTVLGIPAVQLKYDELAEEQRLPILKRKLSSQRNGRSDPFFVSR